ncbi:hypothetical protein L211DRAFT_846463 [Terfezia boudieri ATCC MYA-4762]|uniref:Uncharacterized protein n=1 Tax=Terfezia boudieri ATCC MYA-4762 TaxID=1051890 RepID=A0A3N4MFD9_9PEZI|nr:hypothetical protein L211DRAFT_846463 [Terfezia boudieri ATCC MYA-4762]
MPPHRRYGRTAFEKGRYVKLDRFKVERWHKRDSASNDFSSLAKRQFFSTAADIKQVTDTIEMSAYVKEFPGSAEIQDLRALAYAERSYVNRGIQSLFYLGPKILGEIYGRKNGQALSTLSTKKVASLVGNKIQLHANGIRPDIRPPYIRKKTGVQLYT